MTNENQASQSRKLHSLSPSAWNRFEACPRQYWLSRQRLPRKTGMAASLGTAVHASIEDLVQLDLSGKQSAESGWLPEIAEKFLRTRWEEEKLEFQNTPRRPDWKEADYSKAQQQQLGAITLLLDRVGVPNLSAAMVTVALWRRVLLMVLKAEGELKTSDGKLMGRLDLLLAEHDENGQITKWIVADLKTGKTPEGELYETVRRQLLLYRDILASVNPNHPPIMAEGWYTNGSKVFIAEGPSVLQQAYAAWEATQLTDEPFEPKPGTDSCGGFCDYKAWCPHWWNWRLETGTLHKGDFVDSVVLIHNLDHNTGDAELELCEPADENGTVLPSGRGVAAVFKGRGLVNILNHISKGHKGAYFIGGALTKGKWTVGSWCDVLPWDPDMRIRKSSQ